MGAREPALRLIGLTKRFGDLVANDEVSLTVGRGEIHALLGENGAGKTTLMNAVFGLVEPDAGTIELGGREVHIRSPRDAADAGIGMVHQHFKLVPDMTVAENVVLSLGRSGLTKLRLQEVRARIHELTDRFGLSVEPDAMLEDLSVGQRQRVEILKLLYRGAEVLILDEPTAVLTPAEWDALAGILRGLTAEGKAIVFITHKLDEVFAIASQCTVLRDGRVVGTHAIAETTKDELAYLMVGREISLRVVREECSAGPTVLTVERLCVARDGREVVHDVTFELHEREVLGIAGVDGNGQTELVEALIGVRDLTLGEIRFDGRSPGGSEMLGADRRVAVVPEDRHRTGIALDLSLADNLMIKDFNRAPFVKRGILERRRSREYCARLVEQFDIRPPALDAPMRTLSGGNQQKAVLARELARDPRLLIASQPTRGLDVGAIEFVYARIAEFKRGGGATLLTSTELEEVISLSDRVAVMVGGRMVCILDAADASLGTVGALMTGMSAVTAEPARV